MPNLTPNAAPPGALAESRFGARAFARIRQAREIRIVTYAGSKTVGATTTLLPQQTGAFAARLADLFREDRLYTRIDQGASGTGDIQILLNPLLPEIRISVFLQASRIFVDYGDRGVWHHQNLFLDPIGKPLLELIQRAAPKNTDVQRLSFQPGRVAPPTRQLPPPPFRMAFPLEIQRRIAAMHVGMRRSEIMHDLDSQGGVIDRTYQEFVLRDSQNAQGKMVQVGVGFAPASAPVRWIDGVGYLIEFPQPDGRLSIHPPQDDIVIRISEPYYDYMRYD